MPGLSSWLGWAEGVAAYGLGSWAVQATLLLGAGWWLARLPRLRPAHRHTLLMLALCLAALVPAGLAVPSSLRVQTQLPPGLSGLGGLPPAVKQPEAAAARPARIARPVSPPVWNGDLQRGIRWIRRHPALSLLALWALVTAVRLLLLLVAAVQVAGWARRGRPLHRDRLYAACGYRVADIPVLETPAVQVPSVVGVRRPVILLPAGLATRIDAAALSHVLFHEEGHARRRDPFLRLISAVAEALLFWHPLVPLIRHELETAAEDACDTHALERGSARTAYARTLLSVLELALVGRSRPLACRLGRRGSELKRRVTRILTGAPSGSAWVGYLSLGAMLPALGASFLLEVGSRPGSPIRLVRRSGILAFRHAGVPAPRPVHRHAHPAPPPTLPTPPPTSLPLKPGTRQALPGSVRVEEGSGVPGESLDLLPRRDHLTVFVLDISGDRSAQQLEARRQMLLRIEALPPGDRFNVVAVNSRVLPYASSPVVPNAETLASVRSWLEVLPQEAGSELAAGLRHALAQEEVTSVFLFSDRQDVSGFAVRSDLLEVIERENRSFARVLAVAPESMDQQRGARAVHNLLIERNRGEVRANERPGGAELP